MKHAQIAKRRRRLLLGGLGCVGFVWLFYLLALQGIGIPCLFRTVTGYSCPGCGNSRAVLALLQLDFAGVLQYNLLFPLEFFYLGWVIFHCCRRYLRSGRFSYRPPWPWLDSILLGLVLLWWVLRNLLSL